MSICLAMPARASVSSPLVIAISICSASVSFWVLSLLRLDDGDVLHRLDAAELAPHLVDGLIHLADRLGHGRLGGGILHGVEQRIHAAADDARHARSDRVSHVFSLILRV